ncbi:predicted protein [Histoplasma capsulatum H143]|uniref:Uncharacterized protein n=1 Tax=Ajellomyces capsulatus (strain H143) TaxID=544712 RepID=C6HCL7_AJECH|nr:predicted protein [Histoplasma capsulatum H143]
MGWSVTVAQQPPGQGTQREYGPITDTVHRIPPYAVRRSVSPRWIHDPVTHAPAPDPGVAQPERQTAMQPARAGLHTHPDTTTGCMPIYSPEPSLCFPKSFLTLPSPNLYRT